MPEVVLKFKLPEEQTEYKMMMKYTNYYSALWSMYNQLRQWRKYEERETVTMEELDKFFFDILSENNIEF